MDRIIINEVDNTSNIEALSSYDVAYVPGFSTSTGVNLDAYYRKPTLVTDKYQFVRLFGDTCPTFGTAQEYSTALFPEWAIPDYTNQAVYYNFETSMFESMQQLSDSGFYTIIDALPATDPETYNYYAIEALDENQIEVSNITYEEAAKILNDESDESDESEEPSPYIGAVVAYSTIVPKTPALGEPAWYEVTIDGQYYVTEDDHIMTDKTYYHKQEGAVSMFEAGAPDPGWRYAYSLLSRGMPVYYEQMNRTWRGSDATSDDLTTDDITVENMYAGLESRFVKSDSPENYPDLTFDSMGDYSVKFITSGGYPTFEYNDNALASAMITMAYNRKDAIALIDHTNCPERPLTIHDEHSVINEVRQWSIGDIAENYGAMFTPWIESSDGAVVYTWNGQGENTLTDNFMPGSFAYLTALATQLKVYNPWLAVSGVSRGKVPFCNNLHTTHMLTNNIADSYQALPSDKEVVGSNISINPITYIRNYGYCIWGNRTLRNNADGTKASSFLNIRSAVSDIKKVIFEASQRLLFEQNTDMLWLDFKSLVTPILETMKTDYILADYSLTRLTVDPETGFDVPAYEVMAVIRIQPINSVEIFDLTVYIENTEEFNLQITTDENE